MVFAFQKKHLDELEGKIIYDSLNGSLNHKIGLYSIVTVQDVSPILERPDIYPIGNIPFVEDWLKSNYEKTMKPIEVPKILRTERFLNREYQIIQMHDVLDLPRDSNVFIKNCSGLKRGSFSGALSTALEECFGNCLKTDWFVVSELINIQSEWRVYVIHDKIESIANYDGDPLMFPNAKAIKAMVDLYNFTPHPKSYTIDIAVADGKTSIIEVHPFCCVGLYNSLWGNNLIQAYIDGIEWYKSENNINDF